MRPHFEQSLARFPQHAPRIALATAIVMSMALATVTLSGLALSALTTALTVAAVMGRARKARVCATLVGLVTIARPRESATPMALFLPRAVLAAVTLAGLASNVKYKLCAPI